MNKLAFILLVLLPQLAYSQIDRVLFIGIDGYGARNRNPHPILKRKVAKTPHIDFIQNNSAWTHKAKIDVHAFSGPNWMGMLTGNPSRVHGVETNDCERGKGIPTIFDHLKDQKPELEVGAIYNWNSIGCYPLKESLDYNLLTKTDTESGNKTVEYIKNKKPHFLFVYFGDVDTAGHASRGNSPEYNSAVEKVDLAIGKILKVLKEENLFENTLIIVSSDHGHNRFSNGHSPNIYPVPLYIMGPGVKKGKMRRRFFEKPFRNRLVAPLISKAFNIVPSKKWKQSLAPLLPYLDF